MSKDTIYKDADMYRCGDCEHEGCFNGRGDTFCPMCAKHIFKEPMADYLLSPEEIKELIKIYPNLLDLGKAIAEAQHQNSIRFWHSKCLEHPISTMYSCPYPECADTFYLYDAWYWLRKSFCPNCRIKYGLASKKDKEFEAEMSKQGRFFDKYGILKTKIDMSKICKKSYDLDTDRLIVLDNNGVDIKD
jgi:hypothetical protein